MPEACDPFWVDWGFFNRRPGGVAALDPRLQSDKPSALVGSSLGGMVACEITRIRMIPTRYLIGSASRKEEVSRLLTVLHPLAKVAPVDLLRLLASRIPSELAQMFATMEPSFFRAMCSAIFQWDGLQASGTKVVRIHGKPCDSGTAASGPIPRRRSLDLHDSCARLYRLYRG
jgi:hypothetical protein